MAFLFQLVGSEFRAIRGRVETGMKFKDDARREGGGGVGVEAFCGSWGIAWLEW